MKYYSAIKRRTFGTTWMKLKGIMLSEINQTDKDTEDSIYTLQFKKSWILEKESRLVVARDRGIRQGMGKGCKKIQTYSY